MSEIEAKGVTRPLIRGLAKDILPTAANLLGICFVLMGFIKVSGFGPKSLLDELLVAPISLFFLASILSYHSLRARLHSAFYESFADWLFIVGLISLTLISVYFVIAVV